MDLRIGERPFQAVNQYLVREQIAAGGMGTVYRAFDVQLRRDVALKVLNSLDPVSIERFVREREITADLDHPNFVRILSTGYLSTEQGKRPFYTMPLLRGETLADLIRSRLRPDEEGSRLREEFTLSRLLQLVQQICLALESAHARGIIHGDLKPTNVIVGPYGELYIVDLGLAKYVRNGGPVTSTATEPSGDGPGDGESDLDAEHPAGTPLYMAPEAIIDPANTDARSDIFGVGGILYYILTGLPPQYRTATKSPSRFDDTVSVPLIPGRLKLPESTTGSLASATSSRIPQWHEGPDDLTASSREVLLRALHGVLVPPDLVDAKSRFGDPGGMGAERVTDVVDPAIISICTKALSRKPADRHASGRAVWLELQQYLAGRFDLIHKREAAELTRAMRRATVPAALRSFELAEQGLREQIVGKERAGRFGLDEKLDLFDLLIEKAKVYERRGDHAAIIRSVTRAEPVIETAMEVLQRQHAQLLLARGTALAEQGDFAGARDVFERAVESSAAPGLDDMLAPSLRGVGVACAGLGTPRDLKEGARALKRSIALADWADDVALGVQSRLSLVRLLLRERGRRREARNRLGEALVRAARDPVLLCETHLVLGAYHLFRRQPSVAMHHAEVGVRHARDIDAKNLLCEGHFLLGQAGHELGGAPARMHHFRLALQVRGLRRTDMERRLLAFYSRRRLDPAEIGLHFGAEPEAPSRRAARLAGRTSGSERT